MSFNSPLCKDAPKTGPLHQGYHRKLRRYSGETPLQRPLTKREGVYGKTQYRAPNETLYTLAVRPVLGRGLTMNNSFAVLRLR